MLNGFKYYNCQSTGLVIGISVTHFVITLCYLICPGDIYVFSFFCFFSSLESKKSGQATISVVNPLLIPWKWAKEKDKREKTHRGDSCSSRTCPTISFWNFEICSIIFYFWMHKVPSVNLLKFLQNLITIISLTFYMLTVNLLILNFAPILSHFKVILWIFIVQIWIFDWSKPAKVGNSTNFFCYFTVQVGQLLASGICFHLIIDRSKIRSGNFRDVRFRAASIDAWKLVQTTC